MADITSGAYGIWWFSISVISTFAGNPYFIDLCELIEEGLLSEDECDSYDWGDDVEYIDYEKIYLSRFKILKKAYKRSKINEDKKFIAYCNI